MTQVFAEAAGDVEFQTDAAKVNTTEGSRDMKIGIFARRERGEPATPAEWDDRYLPAPTTRAAFAAIETIDDFAPRWKGWAARLEIEDLSTITVLGDGAEWIWNAATRQFGTTSIALRAPVRSPVQSLQPIRRRPASGNRRSPPGCRHPILRDRINGAGTKTNRVPVVPAGWLGVEPPCVGS